MKVRVHTLVTAFAVLIGLALGLNSCSNTSTAEYGEYFCGAEETTTSGNAVYFKTETLLFGKGKSQDSTHVKSGKFACKVGVERQFGMGIQLEDVIVGSTIYASVWRYSEDGKGSLVVSDETGTKLFSSNARPKYRIGNWAFLELEVRIPAKAANEEISIYVRSDHEKDAWFDDLTIKYSADKAVVDPSYSGAPTFNLEIPEESQLTLQSYRDSAVKDGVISDKYKKYVTAMIVFDGKKVPVKIRLKGDWTDHIKTDKWSFRIKIEGNETWMGMRSFNIQSPHTRNFLSEWVAHKIFEEEDVLTTRYGFVNVELNGTSNGIYAFEEHFEKQLVESQKRREGPILKFDESGFWNLNFIRQTGGDMPRLPFYHASEILPFKKGKTMRSATLKQQFIIGRNLLFQLKTSHRPPAEVLDVEAWGKYYAVLDLARVAHSQNWHNKRFYYNPITCLLEPIAFDCYSENRIASQHRGPIWVFFGTYPHELPGIDHYQNFYLFEYPEFQESYMRTLHRITTVEYIDSFYAKYEKDIETQNSWLHWDFANIDYEDSLLYHNAEGIREQLGWVDSLIAIDGLKYTYSEPALPYDLADEPVKGISLTVYEEDSVDGAYRFLLTNFNTKPAYVVGYGESKITMDSLPEPLKIEAYDHSFPYRRNQLDLQVVPKKLFFSTEPNGTLYSAKVLNWPSPKGKSPAQELFKENPLESTSAYTVNDDTVKFKSGNHTINHPVIIPSGYRVVIPAGTALDFVKGALLFSKSPVYLLGSESQPITITSSDKTAMGFTIQQAKEHSVVQHVTFSNFNTLNFKGWTLTGGVTFYESDVIVEDCTFENNVCEDALNIVRSEFTLSGTMFKSTFGDAFDADFCDGSIWDCKFINAGNDAIDVSGSTVLIRNVVIENPGDKGISVGENSLATIKECVITGAQIGIAAKDLSHAEVESLTLSDCAIGAAAYRKKPEFGAATINVQRWEISNLATEHVIETGSSLTVSGNKIAGDKNMAAYAWYGE